MSPSPPSPATLMTMLALNAGLFGAAVLIAWGVELVWNRFAARRRAVTPFRRGVMGVGASLVFALRQMPWMLVAAIALSAASTAISKALGYELEQQDLLVWLKGDTYPAGIKAAIIAYAVTEAPLLEELLFRRFIFRALLRSMPVWLAIGLSALAFAAMHGNALIFAPLVVLGGAFAWIYLRTGRLIAPMFAHFLFNAANVVMLFLAPDLV